MPNLAQGRIVKLKTPIPDPQGKNPKADRLYIVLNLPESIANGDDLKLVFITSSLGKAEKKWNFNGLTKVSDVSLDWTANRSLSATWL